LTDPMKISAFRMSLRGGLVEQNPRCPYDSFCRFK
jgi:hypothetical protein